MVLYISARFHEKSQIVFKLQSGHEMAMFNVQRAITAKVGIPEPCSCVLQVVSHLCEVL